ncbi:FtsX-like permease family protein [Actinoplanes philippinensis]|uniref:FtsX-like permease family protein n=1 Tax=Actinoplanes philippinensis TaxID=35752 RepID=UPI0033C41403
MSRHGGLPARRAIVRWALRLFRREWRQQTAVLTLLVVAVAAAVLAVSAGYHAAPPATAAFGTARQSLSLEATADRPLDVQVAQARAWFGTIDVIGHADLPIPGSVDTVQLRRQDPQGWYGAPMLHLRDGRYPTAPGEAAVTAGVAARLQTRVGAGLTLDGFSWTVVGTVENPGDLRAEFILDAPGSSIPPQSVTVLTDAPAERFDRFRAEHGRPAYALRPSLVWAEAAAGVFSVFTVGMLLICLIAAAGFAVVAHRRQRQLGLLAAIGATPRHLRLVLLAHGAAVGVAAAVAGTPLGALAWFAVASRFETAAGHRISALDLPWGQIAVAVLLTVVAATVAAWRPAHAAARLPITLALSERPPRPPRARRSAGVAAVLVVLGVVALRLVQSNRSADGDALEIGDVALVVAGTLAIGFALLAIGPAAIRTLAAAAARLPVAARLALRDLARHQARSSAALAAISVALAIPAAIVIGARVLEPDPATGNLSDRQLILRLDSPGARVPYRAPARTEAIETRVRQWAASLGAPAVIPLDVAIDPDEIPSTDAAGVGGGGAPARRRGGGAPRGGGVVPPPGG